MQLGQEMNQHIHAVTMEDSFSRKIFMSSRTIDFERDGVTYRDRKCDRCDEGARFHAGELRRCPFNPSGTYGGEWPDLETPLYSECAAPSGGEG